MTFHLHDVLIRHVDHDGYALFLLTYEERYYHAIHAAPMPCLSITYHERRQRPPLPFQGDTFSSSITY